MSATSPAGADAVPHNGEVSFWMRSLAGEVVVRPALDGDLQCDVAIIGAGFTGLWTAFYLTQRDPSLSIAVLEAQRVGYGASGRNGGYLSHLVPGNRDVYARDAAGHEGAVRLQRAMIESIDEVLGVAERESLAIDAQRGGNLVAGTTPAGMNRLLSRRQGDLRYGLREDEVELLSAEGVRERIAVDGVCGGLYYPMVARIQPARLAFGLAAAVERRGVRIYERSRAETLTPCPGRPGSRPATVTANGATVRAGTVLLCTEGYSGPLAGRRRLIPINSSMVATRPLSAADWASIGWSHGECLSDSAHAFIYSQRTTDDRIAIGGRGRPYRYGSGTGGDGVTAQRTVAQLRERLERYFPQAGFEIEHAWSGVLGVTRDWCAGIEVDRRHGIGHCFGYAGHGVTSANLGGRILADLTTGAQNDLTTLPLVGHRARNWEPEPLRWLGVHGLYRLFEYADRREEASGTATTSPGARLAGRIAGLE